MLQESFPRSLPGKSAPLLSKIVVNLSIAFACMAFTGCGEERNQRQNSAKTQDSSVQTDAKSKPDETVPDGEPSAAQASADRHEEKEIPQATDSASDQHQSPTVAANTKGSPIESEVGDSKPKPVQELKTIENSIGMKLVLIPEGEFLMGSPESEEKRHLGELQHQVKIEKPFYIGMYEVTQAQYEKVMRENRSVERGDDLPVGFVSAPKALEFCERLSELEDHTYRLPTEAEWEYACRAGTTTPFHSGDQFTSNDANFHGGFPYGTDEMGPNVRQFQPVGSYKPNAFGLYDMHGNAAEWCLDRLRTRHDLHIIRGGYCTMAAEYCRSSSRLLHNGGWQWSGLRVVKTVDPVIGEVKTPLTHGIDEAVPYQTEELIEKFEEALAKPAASLLPAVVIFPVMDAERRVRQDGVAMSLTANYAAAYTPQRRMEICLPNVRNRLRAAGCLKTGREINDELINICLAAVGVEQYVLPQLVEENGKLKLTYSVQSVDQQEQPDIKTQLLEPGQLTSVPGVIARGVLEHLGAELDEAEIKHLSTPQFRRSEDFAKLSQMAHTWDYGEESKDLLRLALQNPRSLAAWEIYVFDSDPAEIATSRFAKVSPQLNCDRLKICAGVRSKASQDELLKLLELAPQFHNDTYFYGALAIIAMNLSEPELVEHILEAWREADPGYSGCNARGDFLIDWAWNARGSGWASEVTREGGRLFGARLTQAQQELEKGVEINPLGWEAHTHLITIGMALSLPLEYVDEHFVAAIEVQPRYFMTYSRMFQTLQPRWGGNRDELISFAFVCFKSNFWDEAIPEVGRRAIEELGVYPGFGGFKRTVFRDQKVWDTFTLYAQGAEAAEKIQVAGIPEYKKFAKNLYAKYGSFGGHVDDVAETFRELEKEGFDTRVFPDGFMYQFLRDLVFSQTESGQTQAISAARYALDLGNFDKAEEWIAKIDPKTPQTQELINRSQKAIEVGRELLDKRSLTLSAETMHQIFYGIDSHWKVDGETLQCRLPAQTKSLIMLPFGVERVEVTGTISWLELPAQVSVHSHTRAMRNNVSIAYELDEQNQYIAFCRGGRVRKRERFEGDSVNFTLILDEGEDQLIPTEDIRWTAPVIEQTPSGFGFEVVANKNHHSVVKLSNVRMKLLD